MRQHNWVAGFERYLQMRRGKIRREILRWKLLRDFTEGNWS
jgi:hypothetical protein